MQLKIKLRSAQVFKSPKMNLYAVVDGPSSSSPPQRATVDMHGGATATPVWSPMEFEVNQASDETLVACIKCKRSVMMCFNKSVGFVELGVRALLDYYRRRSSRGNMPVDIALTISSKYGKPRGVLYMAYMFVDPHAPSAPPIEDYARQYCAAAPVAAFCAFGATDGRVGSSVRRRCCCCALGAVSAGRD